MADSSSSKPAESHVVSAALKILGIGILSAVVALGLGSLPFMQRFEHQTLDLRFRLRHKTSRDSSTDRPKFIHPNIVFIGIGDHDLQKYGTWPWLDRGLQAQMLQAFATDETRPRAIGYDVIFSIDPYGKKQREADAQLGEIVEELRNDKKQREAAVKFSRILEDLRNAEEHPEAAVSFDQILQNLRAEKKHRDTAAGFIRILEDLSDARKHRDADIQFSRMLKQLGNVCLPGMAQRRAQGNTAATKSGKVDHAWLQSRAFPMEGTAPNAPFDPDHDISGALPLFRDHSVFGVINAERDDDGVIRRVPILIREGNHWLPSMALRLAMLYHKVPTAGLTVKRGKEVRLDRADGTALVIPIEEDPLFQDQTLRVNYRGNLLDFKNAPFGEVVACVEGNEEALHALEPDLRSALDGAVMIGLTAIALDAGAIPLISNTPLVAVQINTLNNLLLGDFLRSVPWWGMATITLLPSCLTAWAIQKFSAVKGMCIVLIPFFLFLGAAWFLFLKASIWVPMIVPSSGLILSLTSATVARFTGEEKQKRQLRKTMQNYLSANIMEEVLRNPDSMQLGGVRKELTVLFTDVRGFTTFCEKNPPEKVVPLLNEILEVASNVIIRHDGTLDKYIGDAIM
ncbi:MAG: adenylate/guanylate cyclase domain-containing protein, partial [Verrucomicrobia bacterium]|nr:adenylate/guanylate cyclase domain-containing protein [Verrucomicrobiota bacterium]